MVVLHCGAATSNGMEHNIKDIMTTKVVSVSPDTFLKSAIDILFEKRFNGLPVVDSDGFLIGIFTEFDTIIAGASIHWPAFKRVNEDRAYSTNKELMKEDLGKVLNMTVKDVMNTEPLTVGENTPIEDVMKAFGEHHKVNPIPVVSEDKKLVGIVSRHDILRFLTSITGDLSKKLG